ncbi:MAG: PilZ domain-containing protein [Anaerolineales bacterium]
MNEIIQLGSVTDPQEQRREPRFPAECPLAFLGGCFEGYGYVVNFSNSGCAVESNKQYEPGKYVSALIILPDDAPLEIEVAAVRWSHGLQFGLEFIRIQPEMQQRLRGYISSLGTAVTK